MTDQPSMLPFRNAVTRRLEKMFPGYFPNAKHDHNIDFGYPDTVSFAVAHRMYLRNGIAAAAVRKTRLKTWETHPTVWETEESDETALEKEIRERFADLRVWQRLSDADERSMVGRYSGVILRLADNRLFSEPVDTVGGGLEGLVEIIPAWEGQLEVSTWDTDERSETFGQPSMFKFNEAAVGDQNTNSAPPRNVEVHPDRVIVWSEDATVHGRSMLEPGFNALIDMEKIRGAGGEAFWKNAKSAPVLETDKEVSLSDMAKGMGVQIEDIADSIDERVKDFNEGFDAALVLQGITAKTLAVSLPVPEHFFNVALQDFAASIPIPQKILVGMQTGERASSEDAREWAQTNMARRSNSVVPNIMAFLNRLEQFGILPERDWVLDWEDLTEASMEQKIERAAKMAGINRDSMEDEIFTRDEIREVVDRPPLDDVDGTDDLEDDNDPEEGDEE